jgi:hypothetical protein
VRGGLYVDCLYTYHLWHPRLRSDGALVVNVTPGEQWRVPDNRSELFQGFLQDLRISSGLESWEVLRYRSSYQGEPDSSHWEDHWPVNWRVALKLTDPLREPPRLRDEFIGTFAFTVEALKHEPAIECGVIVISDYEKVSDADNARNRILTSEEIKEWAHKLNAPEPRFERLTLGTSLIQEQIYLGDFSEEFFISGAKYMLAVERICRLTCGITNFDERAATRDELYDPDGLE